MVGLAVGPAFAASLLGPAGYAGVVTAGMALFALSFLLISVPLWGHKRQIDAARGGATAVDG